MALRRVAIAAALMWLIGLTTTTVQASDDTSEPLYVLYQGQRIPTVIIPPRATAHAQRAVYQIADPPTGLEDEDAGWGPTENADDAGVIDEDGSTRPRYHVGQYGGYAISIPQYAPPGGVFYTQQMPAQWYGDVIRETYRAKRWVDRQERGRRFNEADMQRREQRILANHEKALRVGLRHLKAGDYAEAVIALQMAAQLNHGDAACRIHLAQARMAQGHYEEAGAVLRRALQLQPKLAYVPLNLGSYYPDPEELGRHVAALQKHIQAERRGVDTWFLLGYMQYQRGEYEAAYKTFRAIKRVMPDDSLTETFLGITKPARH